MENVSRTRVNLWEITKFLTIAPPGPSPQPHKQIIVGRRRGDGDEEVIAIDSIVIF
jgi:hypothetical protein